MSSIKEHQFFSKSSIRKNPIIKSYIVSENKKSSISIAECADSFVDSTPKSIK